MKQLILSIFAISLLASPSFASVADVDLRPSIDKKANDKMELTNQQKAAIEAAERVAVYFTTVENKHDVKLIGKWSRLNREE